ncbi:MAG: FtsH protease activity modulator HflK [Thermodesulfobacteriota bacterium]|nr:FtsH protease activity modulator HflK [Thermodesulfobacteriota bacterium]
MDTNKTMNWDWEKLQQQQQKRKKPDPGDGGPGGSGPGGGGIPPQMEDLLNKFKGFNFSWLPILVVLIIVLLFFANSMYYTIGIDEVGVIQRFGKYNRTTTSGLHFKWPKGIEKITKVRVKRVYKEEFGFQTLQSTDQGSFTTDKRPYDSANIGESLMLTGDLNVALVPWIVQYKIKSPRDYLFNVRDVHGLLRDMSEAAMRLVVGDRSINEVISSRLEIANEAMSILQKEMDHAETGISIVAVELKKTNVPDPVQPSFNEVNQAIQDKETMIYKAREEYNKAVPAAKGEAKRVIKAAEGYALERVNKAKGDADKFVAVYDEYKMAKDVTKRRLYLETLSKVLPNLGEKYIVDSEQQNFLPLLNLGKGKEGK